MINQKLVVTANATVDTAARSFLARAWAVLEKDRVLPASRYRFHLRVGHDYFGNLDHGAFSEFEAAIQAAYPRFAEVTPIGQRPFAASYIHGFLQVCIARLTRDGNGLLKFGPIVDECLADLHEALAATSTGFACLRMTSHLQTHDGTPLTLAGVTLRPLTGESYTWRRQTWEIFDNAMFGAGQLVDESAPFVYAPPECIIAAHGEGPEGSDVAAALSKRISDFLMAVRLLTAATCHSLFEVGGGTQPVASNPQLHLFRGARPDAGLHTSLLRRVARLTVADEARIGGLRTLMEAAQKPQHDMVFTSIGMAARRFTMSFHAHDWSEQVVDLSTALEAALSGADKQDVLLRLRTRATALLATNNDPASAIFKDLGQLYELRSALVHGGTMSTKTLRKNLRLSTMPDEAPLGVALAHAVDRLRDLVRRALLARFALAGSNQPLWPLDKDEGVDANLADDATRARWRQAWRAELASIDAAAAIDVPRSAVEAYRPQQANE